MKQRKNQRNNAGITLVALIITIIILVILAAVSISAVYNSKVVDYAVNGATDYAKESVKENEIMSGTESLLDSTVKKIEDILGGKIPSEPTPGPQKGLTGEELKLKVGAYVNYTPNTSADATYSTTQDGAERSGNGTEQTISKYNNLKWRIMSAEGDKVTLISETIPSENLTLQGADGYNNGVKLLNDAANELYKNTILGATGRNATIEDINGLMGVIPSAVLKSEYGSEQTPSDKYYPTIFQNEKWGSINGNYTGSLEQSEQSQWYSGSTTASILKGKYTYYNYTLSTYKATSTVEHALATGQIGNLGSTTHTTYWLASRSASIESNRAFFNLFLVSAGTVYVNTSYRSDNSTGSFSCPLRPCIEIDLSKTNIGETGSGESNSPYSIAKR